MFWLISSLAFAVDTDPFTTAGSLSEGTGSMSVEAARPGADGVSFGVWGTYADAPFFKVSSAGAETLMVSYVVGTQISTSYTFAERARIDLTMPLYPVVSLPGLDDRGFSWGDLRLNSVVRLVGGERLSFSVHPAVYFPTGNADRLTSGPWRGSLSAVLGGELPSGFGWSTEAGATFAPVEGGDAGKLGSTIDVMGAAWWQVSPWARLGLEGVGRIGLAGQGAARNDLAHGGAFLQVTLPEGFGATVGGQFGLTSGWTQAKYRLFAGIHYKPRLPDRDLDGVADKQDTCPRQAEDLDGFEDTDGCPDLDNDADGVADLDDGCPSQAEDVDGYEDADGCPDPDDDLDGLIAEQDACPFLPGKAEHAGCPDEDGDDLPIPLDQCPEDPGPLATQGCPDPDEDGLVVPDDLCPTQAGPAAASGCPDGDGDGIADLDDACPLEEGSVEENGCPLVANADDGSTAGECEDGVAGEDCPPEASFAQNKSGCEATGDCPEFAVLLQRLPKVQVDFDTGISTLTRRSKKALKPLAEFLKTTPAIQHLTIEGHTDNRGTAEVNQELSAARAQSVKDYLVILGVDPSRLGSIGFGSDKPITTNRTQEGRATNRRVELVIDQVKETGD